MRIRSPYAARSARRGRRRPRDTVACVAPVAGGTRGGPRARVAAGPRADEPGAEGARDRRARRARCGRRRPAARGQATVVGRLRLARRPLPRRRGPRRLGAASCGARAAARGARRLRRRRGLARARDLPVRRALVRRVASAPVPGAGGMLIRAAEPADYGRVIDVVDEWWGGRPMAAMLPKLFFVHFADTSFVAEDEGSLAGFLVGFRSQTHEDEAYVHFVGIDPAHRGSGLGRELYERFFTAVAPRSV